MHAMPSTLKQTPEEKIRILTSVQDTVNRAESNLMQVGGQIGDYSSGLYQGFGGYSVTAENKPCGVCGARGKRREWIYDEGRNKMVKGKMVKCDTCSGRGWSMVHTTHYNTYPYRVTYNTPDPVPTPTPYYEPWNTPVVGPTFETPNTGPFYGSICRSDVDI